MKDRETTEESGEERGVSFARAVELVGEAPLKASAKPARFSNWKSNRQPVPWFVIGPLLLNRPEVRAALDPFGHKAQPSQGHGASSPLHSSLREAPLPAPLEEARALVSRIYFEKHPDSAEWKAVVQFLRVVAPKEQSTRPESKPRKKAGGAEPDGAAD